MELDNAGASLLIASNPLKKIQKFISLAQKAVFYLEIMDLKMPFFGLVLFLQVPLMVWYSFFN